MPNWYNLTSVDASNVLTLTQTIDQVFLYNTFGIMLLVGVFTVAMISFSMRSEDTKFNFMVSLLLISILSVFLNVVNLIQGYTIYVCWVLTAISMGVYLLYK